jgi:hypothetical protein
MPTTKITNDQQLRKALNTLDLLDQRSLGAKFVSSVSQLCPHDVIDQGLQALENIEQSPSGLETAHRNVKSLAIEKYTACGRDADWAAQAEHFVASALAACLLPDDQVNAQENLAWRAAMQARMARNCEMIMNDQGELDNEAARQYAITTRFLEQP